MDGITNPYKADINDLVQHPEILQKMKGNEPNTNNIVEIDPKRVLELIKKGFIQTIDDLETYVYGGSFFNKALTSGSTNYVNTMYGRVAWDQVNREANLFALLKKVPWSTSGWRVITDESANTAQYTVEGGSIPSEEDPAVSTLSISPASIARRSKRSDILDALSLVDDGVDVSFLAEWLTKRHKQIINIELLADAASASTSATHLTPIDRIIANNTELSYGKADNSAVIPANQLDVFGVDRDAGTNTWADAQVSGQAFGSADRPLTLSLLDSVIQQIRTEGGMYNNRVIMVTHPETAIRIDQLCQSQQRFDQLSGITYLRGGKDGMRNLGPDQRDGVEGAFQVSTYRGIPIYEDKNVVQDVSLGRIYFINLDHLFVSVLIPTRFYQWQGPETTASFDINIMYRSVMNTVCTNFRKQGKVRDLSS